MAGVCLGYHSCATLVCVITIAYNVIRITGNAVQYNGSGAVPPSCRGCGPNGVDAPPPRRGISEAERNFRTELVKLQILSALGLERPPEVMDGQLPKIPVPPVDLIMQESLPVEPESIEDEPQKIFIIGREASDGCPWNESSLCLHFKSDEKAECQQRSDKLWIYMNSNITGDVLVYGNDSRGLYHRVKRNTSDDWSAIELRQRNGQSGGRNLSFIFEQDVGEFPTMTDYFGANIPLVEVSEWNCTNHGHRRQKRTVMRNQCAQGTSGSEPGCCLQDVSVNFTAIGWGHFIREPQTFSAKYCRGRCNLHTLGNRITHQYMMYLYSQLPAGLSAMLPCCVAVEKSDLQAYVYHASNGSVTRRIFHEMSASACACL